MTAVTSGSFVRNVQATMPEVDMSLPEDPLSRAAVVALDWCADQEPGWAGLWSLDLRACASEQSFAEIVATSTCWKQLASIESAVRGYAAAHTVNADPDSVRAQNEVLRILAERGIGG